MKTFLILLLTGMGSLVTLAQVPSLMNYQGQLRDANGDPLPTGDYTLTFRIYDDVSSGGLVWGPFVFDGVGGTGHGAQVPVVDGFFNVVLGPNDTDGDALVTAFAGTDRYLEIQVGASPPVSPRQHILSAPYALRADTLSDNAVGSSQIVNGSITYDDMGAGSILSYHILDNNVTDAKISSVNAGKINAGTLSEARLPQNAIDGTEIEDNSLTSSDIASLNFSKINTGSTAADKNLGFGGWYSDVNLTFLNSTEAFLMYAWNDSTERFYVTRAGSMKLDGTLTVDSSITASGGIQLGIDQDITNGDVISGFNDLRFQGSAGDDDFYISSNGRMSMADGVWYNNVTLSIGKVTSGNASGDYSLWLTGLAAKPGGGGFGDNSDRRLKKDIIPLAGTLEKLLQLRSVSFKFNELDQGVHGDGTYLGFIAQEVEPVFPDWVSDGPNGYKMLTIQGFESLAVQALRELRAEKDNQIQSLRKTVSEQQQEVDALRKQVAELATALESGESRLAALEQAFKQLTPANTSVAMSK